MEDVLPVNVEDGKRRTLSLCARAQLMAVSVGEAKAKKTERERCVVVCDVGKVVQAEPMGGLLLLRWGGERCEE